MKISIKMLGSSVSLCLMIIALGGAVTSSFVLSALSDFSQSWKVLTQDMDCPEVASLTNTVNLMSFMVLGGSIATISTLFLVGSFFMWFTNRKIVLPITTLTKTMDMLAQGNVNVEVPYSNSTDEIGVMAHAVCDMKENAIARLSLEAEQKELQEENRRQRAEQTKKIAADLEESVAGISRDISHMAEALSGVSEDLGTSVHKTKDKSIEVLGKAGEATENVNNISTSAQELSSSIKEVSKTINETAQAARRSTEDAHNSSQQIDNLQASIHEIDDVLGSINDIADQTNLLALNATIEAARAGEAGKGFAIVASEVKNLASETRIMTDNITEKVGAIKKIADITTENMGNIIEHIAQLDEKASLVADSIERQSTSTSEISNNIRETTFHTQSVSQGVEMINSITDDSVSIANNLKETSEKLLADAKKLQEVLHVFLQKMQLE